MATRPRPTAAAMTILTSRRVRSRLLISLSWQFPLGYRRPGPCPAGRPPGLSATLPQPGALSSRSADRTTAGWAPPPLAMDNNVQFRRPRAIRSGIGLELQDEPPKLVNRHV